jgi:hypothetical protein
MMKEKCNAHAGRVEGRKFSLFDELVSTHNIL